MDAGVQAPPAPAIPRPILVAAESPALSGRDLAVLVLLHTLLSETEHRVVRPWYLAQRLGVHRESASRTIARLTARGYLEPGPKDGAARTYRLTAPQPAQARSA